MKKELLLYIVLIFSAVHSFAQQDKLVMRFRDAATYAPVKDVYVRDNNGRLLARSDSDGYITVPLNTISPQGYLVAIAAGYTPDTIRTPGAVIFLHALSAELSTTVIRSNKVNKLLHENNEYVVDYDFVGNNVLAATYSGNNGGKAKLFLMNNDGDVLTTCRLPGEPLSLFRSCVGNYYCVFNDFFYLLRIEPKSIALSTKYPAALLPALQECERSAAGNLYYRVGDRMNFHTTYGMIAHGDSVFRPITEFAEPDIAITSQEEWHYIQALLNSATAENRNRGKATRVQLARLKWDRGSYAHISMPLFIHTDTVDIFDFVGKKIQHYTLAGAPAGSAAIQFEWSELQQFEIITDEDRKFYIHRYGEPALQTLEELDMSTGIASPTKVTVAKPFAEHVRVHNGDIYMLWQDRNAYGTRQLYIQRGAFPGKYQ